MIRVTGTSANMNLVRQKAPDFLKQLSMPSVDYTFMQMIANLGVTIQISPVYDEPKFDVWCEPTTGPFCKVLEESSEEDGDDLYTDDEF